MQMNKTKIILHLNHAVVIVQRFCTFLYFYMNYKNRMI